MSSIKRTAIIITIITIGSKFLGFIREVILAYFFGTSYIVDSYFMAFTIPSMIFGWINMVGVSYTPVYIGIKEKIGEEKSISLTNNLLTLTILISIVCVFIGLIFNKQIVTLAAPGFKGEVYELTVIYLKISMWSIIFTSTTQILMSYLNCNNEFIKSNISNLVISVAQMIVIIVSGLFKKELLIFGILFSNIIQAAILYKSSKKSGLKYKIELCMSPEVKKIFIVAIPIFISNMIMQINTFIDKMFASQLPEGSIAALNYSSNIKQFIFYVFSIAITTIIYPILSKYIAENNIDKVKCIFSKSLNIMIVLFIPITIGAIILSEPAISFIYERGEFGYNSTVMTTSAFVMYTIGLLPFALKDVATKVFYSMQDSKSTMYIGIITVALNVILNMLLVKPLGHNGLALATSLSSIITLPLFILLLRKRLGSLGLKHSFILLFKSCIAGFVMGVIAFYIKDTISLLFGNSKIFMLLNIFITACIGGLTFFAAMIIMRVEEMKIFTETIKKLLKK